jgi:8-oxo-dGTP diphosphatase
MPPFVSTSVIVSDGSRLLVVLDPILGTPILPGGHLAWKETPEDAARREVREETGIDVEIDDLVAVLGGEEWAGEGGVVRVIYSGRAVGGVLRSSSEGEASWLPVSEFESSRSRDVPIIERWHASTPRT